MAERTFLDLARRRWRWHVSEPFDAKVRSPLRALVNAKRTYRPVFVAGASGSGTSLLGLSLGQRFDVAGVIYETNFQVARTSHLYVPEIDDFASVRAYQDFMTPTDAWTREAGRSDLLDCYRRYCWGTSNVVVDKGPDINLLRARYLLDCFPDGVLLLIFRDPVANVEGLRRKWKPFGADPLSETIRFWKDIHDCWLDCAIAHPDRTLAVEYEALVGDPDAALGEIGRRIGLDPAKGQRRLIESPNVEGQGIRNVRGSRIGYVTDANTRARERLEPSAVREIEDALAETERALRTSEHTIRAEAGEA